MTEPVKTPIAIPPGEKAPRDRKIPGRSVETAKLVEFLRAKKDSYDTISYEELSRVIGGDIRGDDRSYMASAIRILQNEDNVLYICVRKQGYKRATSSEAGDHMGWHVKGGIKKIKRAEKVIRQVEWSEIDTDQKQRITSSMALIRITKSLTRKKNLARIENQLTVSEERFNLPNPKDIVRAIYQSNGQAKPEEAESEDSDDNSDE